MNAKQKKELSAIVSALEEQASKIQDMASAEQEKFDNLGERAQEGERGERIQAMADRLNELAETVTAAASELSDATEE